MRNDNETTDIALYQANLPAQVSRRIEVEYTRQMGRIAAIGELGMVGMSAMSEVERHAAFKVATTAATAELIAQSAANRNVNPAEQEAQQRLFGEYVSGMASLAEMTNIKIIQAIDQATEELGKRSFADALEDLDARIADALLGRPNYPSRPSLPNGRR